MVSEVQPSWQTGSSIRFGRLQWTVRKRALVAVGLRCTPEVRFAPFRTFNFAGQLQREVAAEMQCKPGHQFTRHRVNFFCRRFLLRIQISISVP